MQIDLKMKASDFSTQQTTDQTQFVPKVPRSSRIKFMKELNHKSNLNLHEEKFNSFTKFESDQNIDFLINKSRLRPQSSCSNYSENYSNVQNPQIRKNHSKTTKLDGQVEFLDDNGNKFKGTYQNGIRISGTMVYSKAKCSYEGSFFGQKFHGHGKLSYFDGRTIEGYWEQHFLIGNSIINYPNGDVYYGEVNKKLHRDGKGHLFLSNGDKYIGDFMNGSITGYGVFYKNNVPIEGHWMQGQLIKEVKPDQSQDDETIEGATIKRFEYLESRSTKESNNSKHVFESPMSPIASNVRLIKQNSAKNINKTKTSVQTRI